MEERRILTEMPKRNPRTGSFELTIRCSLHCKMCMFRHDDSENAELIQKELTASQWIGMAEQAAKAGTLSLTITGGEPFLRPDFCEIWEGIYRQGFLITLYTNAALVNEKIMETLRKYPPHHIGVTLYGASRETYEKVTGNADAYDQAINGIRQLSSLPSIMQYRTTLIKDLVSDLDAMEDIVKEISGGNGWLTESRHVFMPVRGGCSDVGSCRLSAKENIELMLRRAKKQATEMSAKYGITPGAFRLERKKEEPGMLERRDNVSYSLLGCGGGMSTFAVLYDGSLAPCQMLGQYTADALKDGFAKAWEQLPAKVRIPKLCDKCASCKDLEYCEACPASRFAETGDTGGWSEYFCEDASEQKKYYLQDTPL